jgi:hypothetical protein
MRPDNPSDETQSALIVRLGSLHLHFRQVEWVAIDTCPNRNSMPFKHGKMKGEEDT